MIRVLVVDDSALMRKLISDILNSDPGIKVIATAINGKFALDKVRQLGPDIVIMDLEMPEMDGIAALKKIMKEWPLPVIILSSHSETEKTFDAMRFGAVDFIVKPAKNELDRIKEIIISKIKVFSLAKLQKFQIKKAQKRAFVSTKKNIIVIGASTGGPQTLEALLTSLPANIPAPILIVQHMPPVFTKSLAERLNEKCSIEVREAVHGDALKQGLALIAPGGFHMELAPYTGPYQARINLTKAPPELGVRPNINRLFKSAASVFKDNIIAIILTGMGNDGTEGCRAIKAQKGTVIAEAEESCIIYGMPKSVIEAGLADEVVSIEKMPVALLQLLDI